MKHLISIIALLLIFAPMHAKGVTGVVCNDKGKAKKNIVVTNKHTGEKTKTDKNGQFSLPSTVTNDTILFDISKTQQLILPVMSSEPIKVNLTKDYAVIEEGTAPMRVAYRQIPQAPKRKAGVVTAEIIEQRNPQSLYDVLKMGLPGVIVSENSVIIRGVNSFNSKTEPLFIIDGEEYFSSAAANSSVHLRDIKTVEVDREGTSYGMKGSNGVIIITYKNKVN